MYPDGRAGAAGQLCGEPVEYSGARLAELKPPSAADVQRLHREDKAPARHEDVH